MSEYYLHYITLRLISSNLPHSQRIVDNAYHLFPTLMSVSSASNAIVQLRFDFKYYHSLPAHFLWWNTNVGIFIFHLRGSFTNVSLLERKYKQNEDHTKLETLQGYPHHCLMKEIFFIIFAVGSILWAVCILLSTEEIRRPNVINLRWQRYERERRWKTEISR